jgi:hypothetical protein
VAPRQSYVRSPPIWRRLLASAQCTGNKSWSGLFSIELPLKGAPAVGPMDSLNPCAPLARVNVGRGEPVH